MTVHPYTRLFSGKTSAPTVNDDVSLGYEVGDFWLRTNGEIRQCVDNTDGAAVWNTLGNANIADLINYLVDNAYVTSVASSPTSGNIVQFSGTDPTIIQDSSINISDLLAGWKAIGTTWTYASADDPVYQMYVAGNVTANADYKVGNKIKCTVNSVVVYGFIVKVGSYDSGNNRTPVDLYMGTDYDLTNHTITNKYISKVKSPDGFPLSPTKWTVEATNTSDCAKTSPTVNTWYGGSGLSPTGPSIDLPIGAWYVSYSARAQVISNLAAVGNLGVRLTLSTANNSESDATNTRDMLVTLPISTTAQLRHTATLLPKIIAVTSKTTYYLNIFTAQSSTTSITIAGAAQTSEIRAVCAYL